MEPISMNTEIYESIEGFKKVIEAVANLSPEDRERVLKSVCVFYNISSF
jgi:hypothetical protein